MKHRIRHNQLGRNTNQAKALYQGLATSVLSLGRIETTLAKAKAVLPLVDNIVNLAKKNDVNSRRLVIKSLGSDQLIDRIFNQISPAFGSRPSGYTRIIRLGQRLSDGAERAILELVEQVPVAPPNEKPKVVIEKPVVKKSPKRPKPLKKLK
ncbi:50S ribosomal protein L17 [Candidatus Gottesmanbacteria bacterium RIFCSPHIGHO2_01_FULL_47_48]|uniref:50S ribosomal protein L17 n=1 Tax=Candidatus Gottesmanbacteria bacterium RIFCSPHIGHO2_01_FULL_47_48 TaxID=1798381 RepID=A0A1F6A2M6_9BACT|nr:MAG: 50S ribosomal protein L17 [Candidatus Gottesmanbacteria bacterium RIFCSPHIGHO2_01_FULL_47_48]